MQILYEPVAVRHINTIDQPNATVWEAIGEISEKAGHENAKSKYPNNTDPLWKELRAPAETEEIK